MICGHSPPRTGRTDVRPGHGFVSTDRAGAAASWPGPVTAAARPAGTRTHRGTCLPPVPRLPHCRREWPLPVALAVKLQPDSEAERLGTELNGHGQCRLHHDCRAWAIMVHYGPGPGKGDAVGRGREPERRSIMPGLRQSGVGKGVTVGYGQPEGGGCPAARGPGVEERMW